MEGRDGIASMLDANLARVAPHTFARGGEATEADGIVEAWFTFETSVARGKGRLRLQGDKCWTLLTTATELIGHEERRGATREKGAEHGAIGNRGPIARWPRRRNSGTRVSPTS